MGCPPTGAGMTTCAPVAGERVAPVVVSFVDDHDLVRSQVFCHPCAVELDTRSQAADSLLQVSRTAEGHAYRLTCRVQCTGIKGHMQVETHVGMQLPQLCCHILFHGARALSVCPCHTQLVRSPLDSPEPNSSARALFVTAAVLSSTSGTIGKYAQRGGQASWAPTAT